jgi:hypothetical protein
MSSVSTVGGPPTRRPLPLILAILGVLAIIAGVLYVTGALDSVHFLVGSHPKGHHELRGVVSVVVGVVLLGIARFMAKQRR